MMTNKITDSEVEEILKPVKFQIADMNGMPRKFDIGKYRVQAIGVKVLISELDEEKSRGNWKKYNSVCITNLKAMKDEVSVSNTYQFSKQN